MHCEGEQSDLSSSDDSSPEGRLRRCLIGKGLYQEVKQLLDDRADANCRRGQNHELACVDDKRHVAASLS